MEITHFPFRIQKESDGQALRLGCSYRREDTKKGAGLHIDFLFSHADRLREPGFPLFVPMRGVGRIQPTDHREISLQLLPHLLISRAVGVVVKDALAVIAAGTHMKEGSGEFHARFPCHGRRLRRRRE